MQAMMPPPLKCDPLAKTQLVANGPPLSTMSGAEHETVPAGEDSIPGVTAYDTYKEITVRKLQN